MQRDGLRLQLADLRLMRLRTADVAANGLDPDRALRGLTGLAAEGYKAFNSLGIGSLGTDAVVSDPDSVTHPIQQNNRRSYEHRN